MRHASAILSQAIGGLSVALIALGSCLAMPDHAWAQTPATVTCTNGGGDNTMCVSDGVSCNVATAGKQCDVNIACTCKPTTSDPCVCGN